MGIVRTVTGDVDSSRLGRTSMHEHVISDSTVWWEDPSRTPTIKDVDPDQPMTAALQGVVHRNPKVLRDNIRLDDEAVAAEELRYFRDAGGSCIVDLTSIGIGRDVTALRRVAALTDLHIVAGTGFYIEPAHPPYVATMSVDQLAEAMVADLTVGVDGTDIRAGIIGEIGTTTVTAAEEKVLRACGQASARTGSAVSLHTEFGNRLAERSIRILTDEGARPDRIIVGHMDEDLLSLEPTLNLAHLDYHRRVLELGAWVEYDTFGSEFYWDSVNGRSPRDTERVVALAALIHDGFEDQLLVAQDIWVKQSLKRYGGWGYDHLLRVVPHLLAQVGVGDSVIQKLLVSNPRRALALAP